MVSTMSCQSRRSTWLVLSTKRLKKRKTYKLQQAKAIKKWL
jgi:hypothetical protein